MALGVGLFGHAGNRVLLVGAGAAAVFIGIEIVGPFVARPASRVLGAPLAASTTTGKLSQENAMRNPWRTATTAAALMVGVALVSLTTIVTSSMKASANTMINAAAGHRHDPGAAALDRALGGAHHLPVRSHRRAGARDGVRLGDRRRDALPGVTQLSFPVAQLIAVAVLAGLAGIVAAIAPSRRAARLNVLQAVTTE